MRATALSISALLAGVALFMLGNGLLGTLLSLRLATEGAAPFVIGSVMAAYFAGLAIGSLWGHRVISSVGHIRAFAALASIYSAAALAHGFFPSPLLWGILRLIEGLAIAGLFMCVESWLNERSTNETRGKVMSLYMIAIYLAQALGQFLLTLDDPTGFALLALVSAAMSLAVVPVTLSRVPAPPIPPVNRLGPVELTRISPLGVFASFTSGIVLGAFYGLAPAFAQMEALDVGQTAQFMSAAILGGLAMQWPIGLVSDRLDRRTVVLVLFGALAAASGALVLLSGVGGPALLAASFAFGALGFGIYPQAVAHANDHADREHFVGVASGLLLAYSVGAVIGPLAASWTMALIGPAGLFVFILSICIAAAAFTVWRMRQRAAIPVSEQTPFAALPRTTPMVSELDPRAEEHPAETPLNQPPDVLDDDPPR
jgi:MFS family permease